MLLHEEAYYILQSSRVELSLLVIDQPVIFEENWSHFKIFLLSLKHYFNCAIVSSLFDCDFYLRGRNYFLDHVCWAALETIFTKNYSVKMNLNRHSKQSRESTDFSKNLGNLKVLKSSICCLYWSYCRLSCLKVMDWVIRWIKIPN